MNLADFIKRSTSEIVKGLRASKNDKYKLEISKDGIEFDVAVTSSNTQDAAGSITVLSARAKTGEEKIHRLRFKVNPVKRKTK